MTKTKTAVSWAWAVKGHNAALAKATNKSLDYYARNKAMKQLKKITSHLPSILNREQYKKMKLLKETIL